MSPQLVTPRLLLRRWRDDDRAPFAAMNADTEVMEYFPAVLDRAASDALIDRFEAGFENYGHAPWALEERETGRFVGFTGLMRQTFEAAFTPAVEVGWRLARDAWGRGYATEAATASVDYGFGVLGLPEIVSMTAVRNIRSRRVMERLGMTYDLADDFDHPRVPADSPLLRHVLYRMRAARWGVREGE